MPNNNEIRNVAYYIPYVGTVCKHFESLADFNAWFNDMASILMPRVEWFEIVGYDNLLILKWKKD